MVRFYYSDTEYIEVDTQSPTFEDITHNVVNFIPFSTKNNIIRLGFTKRVNFPIDFKDEASFNNFVGILDKVTKISLDGNKFYYATYDGGSFKKVLWAGAFVPTNFSFILQGLQYSLTEKIREGSAVCDNAGNYEAEPEFTITVATGNTHFTISDGTRILTYNGNLSAGDVLVINNWNAYLNGNEVTKNLSGEFPLIPRNQNSFTFTFGNILASQVSIKYRDTWR